MIYGTFFLLLFFPSFPTHRTVDVSCIKVSGSSFHCVTSPSLPQRAHTPPNSHWVFDRNRQEKNISKKTGECMRNIIRGICTHQSEKIYTWRWRRREFERCESFFFCIHIFGQHRNSDVFLIIIEIYVMWKVFLLFFLLQYQQRRSHDLVGEQQNSSSAMRCNKHSARLEAKTY